MPNLVEHLEGRVAVFIEMLTQTCWCCEGKGALNRPLLEDLGPELLVGQDRAVPCDECGGAGELVPNRYHMSIVAGVLNMCISAMAQARAREQFGELHTILDWAYRYSLETTVYHCHDGQLETALEKLGKRQAQRLKTAHPETPPAGALTPDELTALLGDQETPE